MKTAKDINELLFFVIDEIDCKVEFKDVSDYGKVNAVGVHCMPESDRDIWDALESAEKDLFPTVFLYINLRPKLKLVA